MPRADVIIVGGGLAGSVAAIHLARAGASVMLLEKTAGPHDKVCGEFLSGEALAELRRAGLDPAAFGAFPLRQVRVAGGPRCSEAALPFEALSLTRRSLDEEMLRLATKAGAKVRRGVTVREVAPDGATPSVTLKDGSREQAGAVFLATGKHDLKAEKRPPSLHDNMIGLKTYLKLTREADRALGSAVEVVFFPGGYCGFQKVEDGRVNACMAISADRFQSHGGSWPDTARAMTASSVRAAELLAGAEPMLDKPVAVGRVPYGYVRKASSGVFHIGDQAVVIPSFCGEGMGLALRSGRLAAEAYLEGLTASAFQTRFARLAGPRVKGAALLSRLLTHSAAQGAALRTASLAPALVSRLAAVTRTPDERRLSG